MERLHKKLQQRAATPPATPVGARGGARPTLSAALAILQIKQELKDLEAAVREQALANRVAELENANKRLRVRNEAQTMAITALKSRLSMCTCGQALTTGAQHQRSQRANDNRAAPRHGHGTTALGALPGAAGRGGKTRS